MRLIPEISPHRYHAVNAYLQPEEFTCYCTTRKTHEVILIILEKNLAGELIFKVFESAQALENYFHRHLTSWKFIDIEMIINYSPYKEIKNIISLSDCI